MAGTSAGRDIVQPISSEEARAKYLERQLEGMDGTKLPSKSSLMEEESLTSTSLTRKINLFCREQKEKRKTEREAHEMILGAFEQEKSKQSIPPGKEEREGIYSQMAQEMEKTTDVVQRSMSQASTISVKERQMALTKKEFIMIKRKMDKIDLRLNEMYKNWHAEYGNTTTIEECDEIKNFYKPYMDKYESKFRILYQMLQQPRLVLPRNDASGITPSLVALDDATSLKQRERARSNQRENIPRQYSSIEGCLTPHTPRGEDMRLEQSLLVTPEGSLINIPATVQRETLDTSTETTYMELPNTQIETTPKESTVPKSLQGTKEASRAEVLASTQQFFAAIGQRDMNVPMENQTTPVDVQSRDDLEVLEILTTTVAITTVITTSPSITNMAIIDTSSPRVSLLEGSLSHPTITATCRPRTWMQQITEGQTTEPQREGISSSEHEVSLVETLPEEIPDEMGHEWRVLHPFDLPGVRLLSETTPSNQRHLAKNDALVELIQTTEYLDDVPTWGQRDYQLYSPHYGDPFL